MLVPPTSVDECFCETGIESHLVDEEVLEVKFQLLAIGDFRAIVVNEFAMFEVCVGEIDSPYTREFVNVADATVSSDMHDTQLAHHFSRGNAEEVSGVLNDIIHDILLRFIV